MTWYPLFFSFTGRITRSQFWAGLLGLLVVELLIYWPLLQFYAGDINARPAALWFRNLSLLIDTILAWPTLAVLVKRQRDRDQAGQLSYLAVACAIGYSALDAFGLITTSSGVTALGYAAGIASAGLLAIVIVELGMRPGVDSANQFGEQPVT